MNRAILALLLLCAPALAGGKSDIEKTPPCSAGILVVEQEPDILFRAVFRPINIFKARKELCKMPGRVRWNGGCWLPERIPRS